MKDKPALKNGSVGRRRIVAVSLVLSLVLVGVITILSRTMDHRNELRSAIDSRNNARLDQLLKKHPGLVNAELPNRSAKDTWSPLHLAACVGDPETIDVLCRHKAKVNGRDANGLTPLHYAVSRGRRDNAEKLIHKSADVNAKGRDGRTPLDLAKNLRDRRMIELFRIQGARE